MLNSVETYRAAGEQSAKAMNEKDVARYEFHRRWYSRAKGMEREEDRAAAQAAYEDGYRATRVVRSAESCV